ncbi:MAG: hypothetical protein JWO19_5836 [Bryobacterales bacterium]|jgi:hypothetical protein|nr:hypothetical protein [Bryobacterales bacterium]
MKKNITESKSTKQRSARKKPQQELTIGVDLGDRTRRYCVLDGEGKVLLERSVATNKQEGSDTSVRKYGWQPHRGPVTMLSSVVSTFNIRATLRPRLDRYKGACSINVPQRLLLCGPQTINLPSRNLSKAVMWEQSPESRLAQE